jgi:anti-sigma B factor antagonist
MCRHETGETMDDDDAPDSPHWREPAAAVRLHGELDMTAAPGIRTAMDACLTSGYRAVDVDLSAVSCIDSRAVAVLVAVDEALRDLGGRLTLRRARRSVRTTLSLSGVDHILAIAD